MYKSQPLYNAFIRTDRKLSVLGDNINAIIWLHSWSNCFYRLILINIVTIIEWYSASKTWTWILYKNLYEKQYFYWSIFLFKIRDRFSNNSDWKKRLLRIIDKERKKERELINIFLLNFVYIISDLKYI